MPKLEEGNFWIRATFPMSISLSESATHVGRMRSILKKHPEVVSVVSQLGRPDDGTDVAGFNNIELFAPLKPFDEWPRGLTKEKLTEEVTKEFASVFPGVIFNFSQYISDNVEEALSGVKGENSVKVYGPDIAKNEAAADGIVDTMEKVNGVKDLGLFRSMGQPSIKIVPDRVTLQRYGLNTGDVEAVVAAAIGGQAVTQVFEGEKSFNLTVRWKLQYRDSINAIREITVASPDGSQLPLAQLASITEEIGPSVIYREDGRRYSPVKFSVRGRDIRSTVEESQREISRAVLLSPESHLEWSGQINELKEAMARLSLIIPLTLSADWLSDLHGSRRLDRHPHRSGEHTSCLYRRAARAARHRRAILRLRRDGLHLHFRDRDSRRNPGGHLRAAEVGRRQVAGGRCAQRR